MRLVESGMQEKKQIKVVVAIPVLLTGGTEVQTLNLVRVLHEAGHEVVVVCYHEYEEEMVASMRQVGAEVTLLKLKRKDGFLNLIRALTDQFKKLAPDIVHVQYVAPGFVPIVAARLAGVKKLLATVHQPGRTHGWKAQAILRLGAQLCNVFLCVSQSAERSWFGNSALFDAEQYRKGRRHFTIYNAVDTERIAREAGSPESERLRAVLGLQGKKVLGYVGRLRWEKGPSILLDAFSEIVQEVPEAVLLVVGDGSDREELELQAKKLGIAESMVWLGRKSQEEVFRFYGLMDVVAMPSLFEGFGLTAAEAMAAGVPVVAFDVDGLKEVVEDGKTGLLVAPGDARLLRETLGELLQDAEKRTAMGEEGKRKAVRAFSIPVFGDASLSAYQAVWAGRAV